VRIGMTVPWFAIEIARHRLHPAAFDRTVVNATMYDPEGAVTAGFLDRVVAPGPGSGRPGRPPTWPSSTRPPMRPPSCGPGPGPLAALRSAIETELGA
jgi:hypothetical protein